MNVSDEGREFIARFEGLSLKAYLCPAGVPTIGYGHTKGVKMGDTLPSKKAADALLAKDLVSFGGQVWAGCGSATQHQFDALVSLAFNIGIGGFLSSTVLRMHKAANFSAAAAAFNMWNKATIDGQLQPVAGLTRRRAAEAAMYLTPDVADAPQSMPQAVEAPPPLPAGVEVQPSGNLMLGDIKKSTIVQGSNHGALVAAAGTVASVGTAASSFAGLDYKMILALAALAAVCGIGAIVYLLLVKSRRIDMHNKGLA